MEKNWITWFEIPVSDLNRARQFYETIFAVELQLLDLGGLKMAIFSGGSGISGALCWSPDWYRPAPDGALLYLDAGPDLSVVENRIETAGGKVLIPKRAISPEHGFMAIFTDTEGNRIGLMSKN